MAKELLHELEAQDVQRCVPAVVTRGVVAGAHPVAPVPRAQRGQRYPHRRATAATVSRGPSTAGVVALGAPTFARGMFMDHAPPKRGGGDGSLPGFGERLFQRAGLHNVWPRLSPATHRSPTVRLVWSSALSSTTAPPAAPACPRPGIPRPLERVLGHGTVCGTIGVAREMHPAPGGELQNLCLNCPRVDRV